MKPTTRHARAICKAWAAARQSVLDVGRALIAAKGELPHGDYEAMIRDDLPFSTATARKLVAIAEDARLANRSHANVLPPTWTVLYELSQLDDPHFEAAIAENKVSADMTRAAARRLVVAQAKDLAPPAAQKFDGCTIEDLRTAAAQGKRFKLIAADPPWKYETWSDAGADRSPDQHYETMTIEEIAAMPVRDLADPDSILVLWVISTLLRRAFEVMDAWGFDYKTIVHEWAKTRPLQPGEAQDPTAPPGKAWFVGQGKYSRGNVELCLLGRRGNGARHAWATDVRELIVADIGEHSQKPAEFYDRVEALFPGPYLYLFERPDLNGVRPGWTIWGNEVDVATFRGGAGVA